MFPVPWSYPIVQEADLEDVLHAGCSVGHAEVAQRVAHQDDVAAVLQPLEVLGVPQSAVVLVVHVDHLAFEAPQDALLARREAVTAGMIYLRVKTVTAPQQGLTLSSKSMKLETTLMLGW